jgi:hypothetical protein
LLLLTSNISGWANELLFRKDTITVFGGVYTAVNMGDSFNPFANHELMKNTVDSVPFGERSRGELYHG